MHILLDQDNGDALVAQLPNYRQHFLHRTIQNRRAKVSVLMAPRFTSGKCICKSAALGPTSADALHPKRVR
jgi:hypothetical protein